MGEKRTVIAVMMRDINTDFSEVMYSGFYDELISFICSALRLPEKIVIQRFMRMLMTIM